MKLKQYIKNGNDFEIIGRGKTIKPQQLITTLKSVDIKIILNDFENNNLNNFLINNWVVVYYIIVLDNVLVFSLKEYDLLYQIIKTHIEIKNIPINMTTFNNIMTKSNINI